MQIRKLSSREVRSILVVSLSTVVLSTAMLIQPLGLSTGWSERPDNTATPDETTATAVATGTSAIQFDPIDHFEFELEFYSRSQQRFAADPVQTQIPTTSEDFTGDYDPNDDDQPIPDNYNPVDEFEPDILDPLIEEVDLAFTDAEYILYINANKLNLRAGPFDRYDRGWLR